MKIRILALLLLVSGISLGQSVPNTATFTLQDVYNVVDGHTPATTNNLRSCLKNAISAYYDPTYNTTSYAPDSSLLRFRNYTVSAFDPIVSTYSGSKSLSENFSSIEISSNGVYVYLIFYNSSNTNTYLRRYTLSTPYNISTISTTYQSLQIANEPGCGGLYLSPDEKSIFFNSDFDVVKISLNTANDLTSYIDASSFDTRTVGGYISNFDEVISIDIDASGHLMTVVYLNLGYSDQVREYKYYLPTAFSFTGLYSNTTDVYYDYGISSVIDGFEYNSDKSKYYYIDALSSADISSVLRLKYFVTASAYPVATGYGNNVAGYSNLSPSNNTGSAHDFCFSTNKQYMYVLNLFDGDYSAAKIYQYTLTE